MAAYPDHRSIGASTGLSGVLTRLVDIAISLVGCLFLLALLPVFALLIKLDSRGPVFHKCDRVGRGGKLFKMYKLRTMRDTLQAIGASVSPLGDPRVTPVGAMLRRLKLNEFPQFFNILKGDMTLVGPRPEAPDLAAAYPPAAREIFAVKPGLIGPNQIAGRNEEEFYPPGVDPKTYYLNEILPRKLVLDLDYIREKSLLKDLSLLLKGIWATLTGALARRHLFDNLSQLLLMGLDLMLCLGSLTLAHLLRFEGFSYPAMDRILFRLLPWAVLIRLPIFVYFNFYHTLIRHFSYFEVKQIFTGVTVSSLALICVSFLFSLTPGYSRAVLLIDWFTLTVMLIAYRAFLKKLRSRYAKNGNGVDRKRVLIWGAGDYGELCLYYLKQKQNPTYEIIGFIDDDPRKRNKRLNGVKVLGDPHHLEIICQLYKVQEMFVSLQPLPREKLTPILEKSQQLGLPTKFFTADFADA